MVNECRLAMIFTSMETSQIMVYSEQIKEQKLKQVSRELKMSNPMKEICPRLGLRYKANQGLKRGLLIQVPIILQSQIKVGELPLSLKEDKRMVFLLKDLVVTSVV